MSALRDPRVFVPLLLALLLFGAREVTRPQPAPPVEVVHSVELPVPRGEALPRKEQEYELDPEASVVRFLVRTEDEDLALACPDAKGHLVVSPDPASCRIDIEFDLGGLRGVDGSVSDELLWHVLGVHKNVAVEYRAGLVSLATTPLPAVRLCVFDGSLRFGGRIVRQPMELWQTALPGRPLHLMGHGTFAVDTYGLQPRGAFPFLHESHVVTLGLDLAWKRVAHH